MEHDIHVGNFGDYPSAMTNFAGLDVVLSFVALDFVASYWDVEVPKDVDVMVGTLENDKKMLTYYHTHFH